MLVVSARLLARRRAISSPMLTSASEETKRSSSIFASSSAIGCSNSRKLNAIGREGCRTRRRAQISRRPRWPREPARSLAAQPLPARPAQLRQGRPPLRGVAHVERAGDGLERGGSPRRCARTCRPSRPPAASATSWHHASSNCSSSAPNSSCSLRSLRASSLSTARSAFSCCFDGGSLEPARQRLFAAVVEHAALAGDAAGSRRVRLLDLAVGPRDVDERQQRHDAIGLARHPEFLEPAFDVQCASSRRY